MKKLVQRTLLACAVSTASFASINPASAQTSTMPIFAIPLTNNAVFPFTNLLGFTNTLPGGFTNTLVQPTNLSLLSLTNVMSLLLNLQTNIETTLPVLGVLTSNAAVTLPSGTPQSPGAVVPLTQAPAGIFLPPTGQVTNQPAVISMTLGTNVIEIDPSTFQGLVQLRDDLQQALPVLQMLNGTAPVQTNAFTPASIMTPLTNSFTPATRGFGMTPLTGGFPPPLTNASRVLSNPSPF
ncbi:MAG TPA: hypothetical protein VKV04_19665 [Verrucomicrobiae bacterium]|nr:hypothetical protein [Verrucomicrobiae bacterium]